MSLSSVSRFVYDMGLGLALFMEREAGYHLVSLVLILGGVAMCDSAMRVQLARDIAVFGLGVLSRSMMGNNAARPPRIP